MAARCSSRLSQLRTSLEKEITSSEQQRMQLGTDLNLLQQKTQQIEQKITDQSTQLALLEQEKQTLQTQANKASALEASVNQCNQKINDLTQQLQTSENNRAELEQTHQNALSEKEAAIATLTAAVNEQAAQIAEIEQLQQNWENSLAEKEAEIATLSATISEQTAEVAELTQVSQDQQSQLTQAQQDNTELQRQLDSTALHLERLEQRHAEHAAKPVASVDRGENKEQLETIAALQENVAVLEKQLAEGQVSITELQAKLATKAEVQPQPVNDSALSKTIRQQEATIAELNEALAAQANHLFRLEYDLEVKKALISNHNTPLKEIPAAIVAKQEEAEARLLELESKFNIKPKAAKKNEEKAQPKPKLKQPSPSELLNPAKKQLDELTDKAKHLPDSFKGFYKKILSKK
jgi:chromosome segregation ATPase